jgi:glutathione S-transferase
MPIKLYAMSGSPFAWRVWLALEHKKIPYDVVMLSLQAGDLKKPDYLAKNPRGKVPTIEDDGFLLYESAAIVEYLEERYPETPRLFPRDVQQRALARRLVREIDSYVYPPGRRLAGQLFFKPSTEWDHTEIAAGRKELLEELPRFESALKGDFFLGELGVVDYSLYPLLALWKRFELKKPDLDLTPARGLKLRAWAERIEALPYFAKTYPPHWR